MNLFGIGPLELVFIVILMILVLGPQQMVTSARKLGVLIRKVVKSPMWSTIMDTSREIREIPTRLIREAGVEEDLKEIRSATDSVKDLKNFSVTYQQPPKPVPADDETIPESTDSIQQPAKPTSGVDGDDHQTNQSDEPVQEPESHPDPKEKNN